MPFKDASFKAFYSPVCFLCNDLLFGSFKGGCQRWTGLFQTLLSLYYIWTHAWRPWWKGHPKIKSRLIAETRFHGIGTGYFWHRLMGCSGGTCVVRVWQDLLIDGFGSWKHQLGRSNGCWHGCCVWNRKKKTLVLSVLFDAEESAECPMEFGQ